tara:strand:- start:281 stop:646 length:366 start_codon:yes stop_codon:yes gene_type:complete
MFIHFEVILFVIIIYEYLNYINIFKIIKKNIIIFKKIIKIIFLNKVSDKRKQKVTQSYSIKLFINSLKILLTFTIIIIVFLLFLFLDKNFIYFIDSISGIIEITILSLVYHVIKKKINAKL